MTSTLLGRLSTKLVGGGGICDHSATGALVRSGRAEHADMSKIKEQENTPIRRFGFGTATHFLGNRMSGTLLVLEYSIKVYTG